MGTITGELGRPTDTPALPSPPILQLERYPVLPCGSVMISAAAAAADACVLSLPKYVAL